MKLLKHLISCVLFVIISAGAGLSQSDTTSLIWKEGYLDIHHINTGRGVSTFFALPDGTTMLVDAGDMDDSVSVKSLPLTITPPYPDNSKTAGQWIADYIRQVTPQKRKWSWTTRLLPISTAITLA